MAKARSTRRTRPESILLAPTESSRPRQKWSQLHMKAAAVPLWASSLAATLLNVWLLVLNREAPGPLTTPSEFIFAIGYLALATLGAAIVLRDGAKRLGWILLGSALALSLAALASEYAVYSVVTQPRSLPGVRLVAWFGAWAWWAGAGSALTAGLLLYPTGSLPSPRWRPIAWGAAGNVALLVLLHALAPGQLDGEYAIVTNPLGIEAARQVLRPLRNVGWLLLAANALLGLGCALVRLRSSSRPQRRQMTWLTAAGCGGMAAALVWGITRSGEDVLSPGVQAVVVGGAFALPIAIASAVMRDAGLRRSFERSLLAREEERRRIRRDLHDGLGPTLAGIGLQLEVAKGLLRTDPDAAEATLGRLSDRVTGAVGDIRRLLDDLRPPLLDQLGLVSAIEEGTSYLTRHSDGDDFAVSVEVTGDMDGLPAALEVGALRIVMEAVTNAYRHARASTCSVGLTRNGKLEISIADDGVGVSPEHLPGVGLTSMCERATELGGTCRIRQRPEGGTLVQAEIPIDFHVP